MKVIALTIASVVLGVMLGNQFLQPSAEDICEKIAINWETDARLDITKEMGLRELYVAAPTSMIGQVYRDCLQWYKLTIPPFEDAGALKFFNPTTTTTEVEDATTTTLGS